MAIISVEGQFYIHFKIGDYEDFLDNGGALLNFVIQESAGGNLPMFEMEFRTSQVEVIPKLNEGNKIECRFGFDEKDAVDIDLRIQKVLFARESDNYIVITIKGLSGNPSYLNDSKIKGFLDKNSKEVIKETVEQNGFTFKEHESGVSTPSDKQNWIRNNQTPISFVDEVWKHSYINDDDFYLFGITKDSKFLFAQYSKLALEDFKWILDVSGYVENSIVYNSDYEIRSNTGLNNAIGVYNRERRAFNIEDGTSENIETPDKKPILASSSKLSITEDEPTNQMKSVISSSNIHDNYNKAVLNNTSKIILHGTTEIEVRLASKFLPFELFDMVLFLNNPIDKENQADIGMIAGNYIITEIRRFFYDMSFGTSLILSRDSLNTLEGDLK